MGDTATAAGGAGISGEDLERLLANPYVERFENNRITYTRGFHIEMHRRIHDRGMSYVDAYEDLGFDVSVLGENRAWAAGRRTKEMWRNNSLLPSAGDYDGSVPPDQMGEMAPEEELAYLRARNMYLETVLQTLKKTPSASAGATSSWRAATSASTGAS